MAIEIIRNWPGIRPSVRREVEALASQGVKASIVNPRMDGHYFLDPDKQIVVNQAIETWSAHPNFTDELFSELSPGARAWAGLSKRAIALHAFYNTGTIISPSDGIDPACLDWELFDGKSARQLTIEETPDKSERILQKYDQFFAGLSLREGTDRFGLTAHDYIAGSVDRIADVSRAEIVSIEIVDHTARNLTRYQRDGVVFCSIGSGLIETDMWTARMLEKLEVPVHAIHGFDNDPIALAAATSRAKENEVESLIQLHRINFVKHPINNLIEKRSVDYANLVGFFEYLPRGLKRYNMASNLLRQVAQIVKPGGLIIFGNMVAERLQQKWFEGIWPTLYQRKIEEVLSIIEEAGFERSQVSVKIAEGEGLYAIYTIQIPESGVIPREPNLLQKSLGQLVLHKIPEY